MESWLHVNVWTVISAFLGFLFAEVLKERLFGPRQKQRELRARIHSALIYFANAYPSPAGLNSDDKKRNDDLGWAGQQELRKLATEVLALDTGWKPLIARELIPSLHKDLLHLSNLIRTMDERLERPTLSAQIAEALKLDGREADFSPAPKPLNAPVPQA